MFKRLFGVLRLDGAVFREIDADERATGTAVLVAIAAGAIGSLNPLLDGEVSLWTWFIAAFTFMTIFVVVAAGLLVVAGRVFGGTATFKGLVRTVGFAMLPQALGVVPALGVLAFVWTLVGAVIATRESHRISTGQAVGTLLGPLIVLLIVGVLAATVFTFSMFGSMTSLR